MPRTLGMRKRVSLSGILGKSARVYRCEGRTSEVQPRMKPVSSSPASSSPAASLAVLAPDDARLWQMTGEDHKRTRREMIHGGGEVRENLDDACTHLIVGCLAGAKYKWALDKPSVHIVHPSWVWRSLESRRLVSEDAFDPRTDAGVLAVESASAREEDIVWPIETLMASER